MLVSTNKVLGSAERLAWLRLIRSENVGPVIFRQLIAHFGDAPSALAAVPDLAKRGGRKRPIKLCDPATATRELEALEAIGAELVAACEPSYPAALANLDDAPPVISVLGHTHLLSRRAAALVGARNASANGRRLAAKIAGDLADAGYLVVSGLARGIYAAAHQGALSGGTAAVVAGGVDVIYPRENTELYEAIREQGVIISELPLGIQPQARHFPRRNRIISGIALGIVVVEAAPKSGSLITARFAGEQGRLVFAVPGSPLDPRAQGANNLIKEGALLVESAEDVIEALEPMTRTPLAEPDRQDYEAPLAILPSESELERGRLSVLDLLSADPVAVDELIRQCQLSPAVVTTALLELELAGRIERYPGNRVARRFLEDEE